MTQTTQSSGSAAANFGMAAWVTYGVGAANGHWVWAAIGGLAIALAIVGHEYSRNAVKIMDCTTAAYFAFALIVTIAAGPWLFKSYNLILTWAIFAAVTWVTMLIGFPFTTEYAREHTNGDLRSDVHRQCDTGPAGVDDWSFGDAGTGSTDVPANRRARFQFRISEVVHGPIRSGMGCGAGCTSGCESAIASSLVTSSVSGYEAKLLWKVTIRFLNYLRCSSRAN
jgi:hypothetical protein